MKTNLFRKTIIATIIAASALSLTACIPANNTSSNSMPEYIHGDVIDNKEVKDQYGTYMSTKLSPTAKALIYNRNRTDASLYDNGFTDKDAEEAQRWVANWVAEQGTDSIVLDNSQENDKWIKEQANSFGGTDKKTLLDNIKNENSSIITSRLPLTVRDGKSRVLTNSINIYGIGGVEYENKKYIQIYGIADTVYRISENNLIDYLVKSSKIESKPADGSTPAPTNTSTPSQAITAEDIQNSMPELANGKDKKLINQFEFTYTLTKTPNGWEIVSASNTFNWNWAL